MRTANTRHFSVHCTSLRDTPLSDVAQVSIRRLDGSIPSSLVEQLNTVHMFVETLFAPVVEQLGSNSLWDSTGVHAGCLETHTHTHTHRHTHTITHGHSHPLHRCERNNNKNSILQARINRPEFEQKKSKQKILLRKKKKKKKMVHEKTENSASTSGKK